MSDVLHSGRSSHGPQPVCLQTLAPPSNKEINVRYWETLNWSPMPNVWIRHNDVSPPIRMSGRDVPVIHPVPGKCRISHYSVLPGPGKIMKPSNKKKFFFFLLSKKLYGIVDKNMLCRIKNIQTY